MKKLPSIIFSLFVVTVIFLCYSPKSVFAAANNWLDTSGDHNWNTATNWSLGRVPNNTTDTATFSSANSNDNVTINATEDVFGVSIASTYTGTITQSSGSDLTVEGGNYAQAGGIFTGSSTNTDDITMNGTFTVSGGTFTSSAGNLAIRATTFNTSGGTFNANGGTVTINNNTTVTFTGSQTLFNLTITSSSNGKTYTISSGTTITVSGTFTNASTNATCNGPGSLNITGNIDATTANECDAGNLVVTIGGSGSQTWDGTGGGGYIPAIKINKSGGTFTIKGFLGLAGQSSGTVWEWDAGTVDATTNTSTVSIGTSTSSLTLTNSGSSITLYNLTFTGVAPNFTIASGSNFTVAGTLTMTSNTGDDVNGPGTITASGNLTCDSSGSAGNVAITLSGTNSQTLNMTSCGYPTGTVTVSKTSGTVTLSSNWSITDAAQDFVVTSGANFNLTGAHTLTVGDLVTISGTMNQQTTTISSPGYIINSTGVWNNASTGAITIGASGMSNSGALNLGTQASCTTPATGNIAITSTSNGVARTWSGLGTYSLYNISVKDQIANSDQTITAYSSVNVSNTNFVFNATCGGGTEYWKFDEGYGTTAHNSVSAVIGNGTLSGSTLPAWKSEDLCLSGKCLYFDGSSSYVNAGNTGSPIQSVSFWVRPTTTSSTIYFLQLATGADIYASSNIIQTDGFSSPIVYVNGVVNGTITTNTWDFVEVTTATPITASSITLGRAGSNYLKGFLDEVNFYTTQRTASQVKVDYNSLGATQSAVDFGLNSKNNKGAYANGLLGYWKMDESAWTGSAGGVVDSSGNANNATAHNLAGASDPTSNIVIAKQKSSANIIRTGRIITRANDTNSPATLIGPANNTATNLLDVWQASSPYTSWTDKGSLTDGGTNLFNYTDDSAAIDVDGIQASGHTATNNQPIASQRSDSDAGSGYITYPSTINMLGTDFTNTNFVGPVDTVVLPNGHAWFTGIDSSVSTTAYATSGTGDITVGLKTSATGALITTGAGACADGQGDDIIAGLTNTAQNTVTSKIAYNGTGATPTVYVIYNDGKGNLKYASFSDSSTTLPGCTITGPTTLLTGGVKSTQFNVTTDTAGNMHLVAANKNGIQYWYMPSGSTSWSGPYTVSSDSLHDDYPTIGVIGSSTVTIIYGHSTGTANKNNVVGNSATIVTSGSPTFAGVADVFTDAGTVNASGSATERISADGSSLLVAYQTGTASPWAVNVADYTPVLSFGDASLGSGKFGNGGSFGGSSGYLSVANTINGVKSVSFWVNPTSSTGGLIQLTSSAYITVTSGTLSTTGLTNPTIYVNGVVGSTLSTSVWQHVVVTFTSGINANAVQFAKANGSFLTGSLDEVRFYDHVLAASDVTSLYKFVPGPIAYYNFEEGNGNTANDSSGYGNTGTWAGTGKPHYTSGKYGWGGNFNGTDDDVSVSSTIGQAQTVAFWVNPTVLSSTTALLSLSGSAYITSNASGTVTATGFTSPSIYINGVLNGTIVAQKWNFVTVTTGTQVSGSAFTIGLANSGFFNGGIDEVRVYSYVLSSKQIVMVMNADHPPAGSPVGSEVGWWKFNEGYGTVAHNSGSCKTSCDGTLSGTTKPSWDNNGKLNKALKFDGATSYVDINNTTATGLQLTSDLTLSAWINLSNTSSVHDIIAKDGTSGQFGYRLYSDTNGKLSLEISSDGTGANMRVATSSSTLTPYVWYHVVGTYSQNNAMTVYVNGKQVGQVTTALPSAIKNSSADVNIGAQNSGGSNFMNGFIDEAKIYSYALTSSEVLIDYNSASATVFGNLGTNPSDGKTASNSASAAYCIPGDTSTCGSPVAEYNFEEGSGTTVNDTSGKGNTGTWSGTGVQHYSSPGKPGWAGNFNGTDDYVDLGNVIFSDANFTVSAWVNIKTNPSAWSQIISSWNGNGTDKAWGLGTFWDDTTINGSKSVYFQLYGAGSPSGTVFETPANSISLNGWHHIEAVRTGDKTANIYIDGVSQTLTTVYNHAVGTVTPSTQTLRIGGYFPINAAIDQVRIYDYARTPAQVAWDYNRGKPIGWWKLDECSGSTAYDSSGNGNFGTITIGASGSQTATGTCTDGNSNDAWNNGAIGKFNASLKFDGIDDNVSVANTISSVQSVSFWVKPATASASLLQLSTGSVAADVYASSGSVKTDSFVSPTIYVNGNLNGTFVAGNWNHVVVTTGTGITANNIIFGKLWRGVLNGQLDDVRLYNYVLTLNQVQNVYNDGAAVRFGPLTGSP